MQANYIGRGLSQDHLEDAAGGMTLSEIGGAIKSASTDQLLICYVGDSITARQYRVVTGCSITGNGDGTSALTLGAGYNMLPGNNIRLSLPDYSNSDANGVREVVSRVSGTSAVISSISPTFADTINGINLYFLQQKTDQGYATFCDAALIESGYNMTSQNFGVAGATSAEILERISEVTSAINAHNGPSIVVELTGTNDAIQDIASDTTIANRRAIWSACKSAGAAVVVGSTPITSSVTYNALIDDVNAYVYTANSTDGVIVWDYNRVLTDVDGNQVTARFNVDTIHPDPSGASRGGRLLSSIVSSLAKRGIKYSDDSRTLLPPIQFADAGSGLATGYSLDLSNVTSTSSLVSGGESGMIQLLDLTASAAGHVKCESTSFHTEIDTSKSYIFSGKIEVSEFSEVESIWLAIDYTVGGVTYQTRALVKQVNTSGGYDTAVTGVFETEPFKFHGSPTNAQFYARLDFSAAGGAKVRLSDFYSREV